MDPGSLSGLCRVHRAEALSRVTVAVVSGLEILQLGCSNLRLER